MGPWTTRASLNNTGRRPYALQPCRLDPPKAGPLMLELGTVFRWIIAQCLIMWARTILAFELKNVQRTLERNLCSENLVPRHQLQGRYHHYHCHHHFVYLRTHRAIAEAPFATPFGNPTFRILTSLDQGQAGPPGTTWDDDPTHCNQTGCASGISGRGCRDWGPTPCWSLCKVGGRRTRANDSGAGGTLTCNVEVYIEDP